MAHRAPTLSPTPHSILLDCNHELHAISHRYESILAKKGMEKKLIESFTEAIRDYSEYFNMQSENTLEAYADYLLHLTAVLENIGKMTKKPWNIFTETLTKWIERLNLYRTTASEMDYQLFRATGFNRLFSQLGDPSVKRKATIRMFKEAIKENFMSTA